MLRLFQETVKVLPSEAIRGVIHHRPTAFSLW
jgi:hypothetical protein